MSMGGQFLAPLGQRALLAAIVVAVIYLIAGCSSSRSEEKASVEVEHTAYVVPPLEIGTPVGPVNVAPFKLEVDRRKESNERSKGEVVVQPSPQAVQNVGGGILTAILGGTGWGAALLAFLSRNRAFGALRACADGIEAFKQEADEKEVTHLQAHLSRRMDKSHKDLIRKVKP